jgi:hypothetical protein
MAKEVSRGSDPIETLRAADADRHQIAEQLKSALDEGRLILWTIWGAVTVVNLVVWVLVAATTGFDYELYPWPVWLLVPGAALLTVTVGVQTIRHQQRTR